MGPPFFVCRRHTDRHPGLSQASAGNTSSQSEVFAFGVNSTNIFSGVDTAVSATYVTATNELDGQQEIFDGSTDKTTDNTFGIGKDRESYSFRGNLGD